MTLPPRSQHPRDAFQIKVLSPVCPDESKRLVQPPFGIRDARNTLQLVRRKEFLRSGLIIGEVDEGELHAPKFDIVADFSQLGDRLATKRSTEVPQKNQQQRPRFHQRGKALAILCLVLV